MPFKNRGKQLLNFFAITNIREKICRVSVPVHIYNSLIWTIVDYTGTKARKFFPYVVTKQELFFPTLNEIPSSSSYVFYASRLTLRVERSVATRANKQNGEKQEKQKNDGVAVVEHRNSNFFASLQ